MTREINSSEPSKDLRRASPFLHAVCCLHGIPHAREDWPAVDVRRQVYERVRLTLGQALLASPLPLDEISAILLMSVYSNQSPGWVRRHVIVSECSLTDQQGSSPVDYIDSWLLTGYCAQQAMLSISFSDIVQNIKRGSPTSEDRRAIRLWANICLHHLQSVSNPPPGVRMRDMACMDHIVET